MLSVQSKLGSGLNNGGRNGINFRRIVHLFQMAAFYPAAILPEFLAVERRLVQPAAVARKGKVAMGALGKILVGFTMAVRAFHQSPSGNAPAS